jgi:hypothetical protein
VGCSSDRECALLLKTPRGKCTATKTCTVPCTKSSECDLAALETCHDGVCSFVGCENDTECRAFLSLDPEDTARAVCR